MKEQIYGGLLLCVHCSGRQGSKTRDTPSPVLHLLDKNIPCLRRSSAEGLPISLLTCRGSVRQVRPVPSPVCVGRGWMTHPRSCHRGLLPRMEGAQSWHESLEAGLDVTALDFPLPSSSGYEACCPWKGLTIGTCCLNLSTWEAWKRILAVRLEGFKHKSPL